MHVNDGTLYPMLGVGAFMPMFWLGFLLGHAAGLHCLLLLISGLTFGWFGCWAVARLESIATGRRRRITRVAPDRPPRAPAIFVPFSRAG